MKTFLFLALLVVSAFGIGKKPDCPPDSEWQCVKAPIYHTFKDSIGLIGDTSRMSKAEEKPCEHKKVAIIRIDENRWIEICKKCNAWGAYHKTPQPPEKEAK